MPPPNYKRAVRRISLVLLATLLIALSLFFIVHADSSSHVHSVAGTPVQSQNERLKIVLSSTLLSDFDEWVKKVRIANSLDSVEIEKGRVLALNRRELFKELMSLSPESALDHAIPNEVYRRMPASITTHLETPVSAYGDFKVYVVMLHQNHHSPEMMTGSRVEREVTIGTTRYRALVYGRRESITTKLNIPLQGIILDDMMVVDEDPVRRVDPSQYQALNVDRAKALVGGAVAEVGGRVVYFSTQSELETFVRDEIAWEEKIGPVRPTAVVALSPWTTGLKTVLVIRLDFPDKEGEPLDAGSQPLTVARAQNLINNEVSPFYVSNSLNQTSLQATVTPVVRMPQPESFYFTNVGSLFSDAESAARAAGFDPNNFNLDIFAMSYNPGFGYGGIASVGARGAALNGLFDLRVTAHELGHNYGLWHANLWATTDGSIIGPGNNVEYGNPFDVMGGGFDTRAHFEAHYKRRLEWITDANVKTIDQDGVYRVFAHDSTTTGGIRALKIKKNVDKNYWIEFRQLFTNIPTIMNGAIVTWDYGSTNFRETQILDMTPATGSIIDAPLQIGDAFHDGENQIRITVLGKGNTTPESLDIKVELNAVCTFSLSQTSQSFTASGGEGSIPVTSQPGCRASATSNSSWLQPINLDSSTVRYLVAANYDSSPRTGMITVADETFTVTQAAAVTACAPAPQGLVAWWRGEGNGLDETGLNSGAPVNSPRFIAGKVGAGFFRDFATGGGYHEVPDSSSLTLTKSVTIEGWVKLNSANGYVLRRARNFSPFINAYDLTVFGSATFTIYNDTQAAAVFGDPLPLGQFVHIAATLDDNSGKMSMYVNGNPVKQITTSLRPNAAAGATVWIGDIDGVTDELSVYNRALSASEVLAIYNAGNASTGAAGKCLVPSSIIELLKDPTPSSNNRVIAMDSVLFTRDPFQIINPTNLLNTGSDRNTRVLIFVRNLRLDPGELPSAVVVSLFDPVTNRTHLIPAENVWSGIHADFSQVTFRLPDDISPTLINMSVKFHGQTTSVGRFRIN
jgi:hypothetical protein